MKAAQLLRFVKDYGFVDKLYYMDNQKDKNSRIGEPAYRREIINKDKPGTWVCFLPWRVTIEKALEFGLLPKKSRAIVYEGPIGLIHPDPNETKKILFKLYKDLKGLNLKDFSVLGFSGGTYLALYMAKEFKAQKLVLVAPGARLGDCIWDSIATKEVVRQSIGLGFTKEKYDEVLTPTNLNENLQKLPSDIEMHIASHDRYIPARNANQLVADMKKKDKKPAVRRCAGIGHTNMMIRFGHDNPY